MPLCSAFRPCFPGVAAQLIHCAQGKCSFDFLSRTGKPCLALQPEPEPRAWQRMLSGRRLDLLDPVAARHRDRGHRAWARPRRPLERPDDRRSCLLGGGALPARRDHRRRAFARARPPLPARGPDPRCAGICHRRPDQPVQGGARRSTTRPSRRSCSPPSIFASGCRPSFPPTSPS